MNTLFINRRNMGHYSSLKNRSYNEDYVFLMEGGYYIRIECSNIKSLTIKEGEKKQDIIYMFELYK